GSMIMADYVAKFKELSRHFPHYQNEAEERSKIFYEDHKARVVSYKKFGSQSLYKMYFSLPSGYSSNHWGSQGTVPTQFEGGSSSRGTASSTSLRCMKYGKLGHYAKQCSYKDKQGHIGRSYTISKKDQYNVGGSSQGSRSKTTKRVFTVSGTKASYLGNPMQEILGNENSYRKESIVTP
ncbi:hypothetical protein CR513_62593, partial [Mucuna pruriens]